jgi:nucleotide-binding universal stress UspA family protein
MVKVKKLSRVLVAIDGSNESMRAAEYALSIAVNNEAELILLHVFYSQLAYAYTLYLSKVQDSSSFDAILRSAEEQANRWFNVIKNKLEEGNGQRIGIKSEVIVTSTSVSKAILEYAEHNKISLIAIGAKSKSALKKVLLGSATSELLINSPTPVLVVK